ncbi:MAG: antibiotic biosynthesis monooxygenase [Planctomycetes bacterium]|nr:antibiotic biosynthesis monooxygenase [Planctomycetota bacterium]MCH9724545.1 antibiotic biosynthesis monooxygenase [Planctomycetota bacterium]MCH9779399.1 antibiotic biosynthesis monooxygenase [Planctomycetota bacterium]MCH9791909.1 antibiotic biosynthesis monooxygenase [Planctomycetota bacterium]MDF1745244.1 putative quinol monooxygenase [Gimesia sp.]
MIFVIADIELAEGKQAAFLEAFHKLVPLVLAEEGCIEYGPAIDEETDIPAQVMNGNQIVTVMEKWASVDALKAHLTAPHMTAYREQVADLVKGTKLKVLKPA